MQKDDLRVQLQHTLGDDYQLEHELQGGMSRVFVASQRSLGRRVVVKVLPEVLGPGTAERFRREVLFAAQLHHPHIVGVLTAGESDGLGFYMMPFVEGESLWARLGREGTLAVARAEASRSLSPRRQPAKTLSRHTTSERKIALHQVLDGRIDDNPQSARANP